MVIIVFMMLIMIMTTNYDYDDEKARGPVQEDEERGTRIAGVMIVLLTFFFYNVALLSL